MSELYESVIISGITTIVIALGTLVWKWILQYPVLTTVFRVFHGGIDLRGTRWQATWPYGREELVIQHQAGRWLYGERNLHFQPARYYKFRGELVGNVMVAYCVASDGNMNMGAILLRFIGDGRSMEGMTLGINPTDGKLYNSGELNRWERIE